ncbi:hypothetical protein DOM22_16245 [Bdellovibrio sp. ZAP7]|nr:hypothetical protein DOM22_16245 [Bdellovibrio sp. ZAP7]
MAHQRRLRRFAHPAPLKARRITYLQVCQSKLRALGEVRWTTPAFIARFCGEKKIKKPPVEGGFFRIWGWLEFFG